MQILYVIEKNHDILKSVFVSFRQPLESLETNHSSHNQVIIFDITSMRWVHSINVWRQPYIFRTGKTTWPQEHHFWFQQNRIALPFSGKMFLVCVQISNIRFSIRKYQMDDGKYIDPTYLTILRELLFPVWRPTPNTPSGSALYMSKTDKSIRSQPRVMYLKRLNPQLLECVSFPPGFNQETLRYICCPQRRSMGQETWIPKPESYQLVKL